MIRLFNTENSVKIFWTLFALTLIVLVGMQITGAPLKTTAAPGGIVSFELIGSFSGSQNIIQTWQGSTMLYAGLNMGLDFLFLTLYALTIALGCHLLAARMSPDRVFMKQTGIWLGYGILLAAFLDIIENISLIKLLTGSQSRLLPQLARWCATPKFILVLLALLYLIIGVLPVWKKSR